jgi:ankyrin repeat protein
MSRLVELVSNNASLEALKANLWDNRNIQGYINCGDDVGYTALAIALLDEKFEIAEFLLKNGADINNLGALGSTILARVCALGYYNSVKFLLEYGADINVISERGYKAEELCRDEDILRLLKSYKKNINTTSINEDNYAVINGVRYKLVHDKNEKKTTGQTFTFPVRAGGSVQDGDGNVLVSTGDTQ